jgi:hypothetical protein
MYANNQSAFIFELTNSVYSHDYSEVRVRVVAIDGDRETTYDSTNPAEGFQAYASGNTDDRERSFTYWNSGVQHTGSVVSEYEAERIHKLMVKLRKSLDKMSDEYGYATTFGTYVQRLSKALGVKLVGFFPPNGQTMWASGEKIRFQSPSDASHHIDSIIRDWKEQTGRYAPKTT